MEINPKLKEYIEKTVFPSYSQNDFGHNLDHIKYVINRSFKFASTIKDINYDMVYVIAAYHDIGHFIDPKNHEKISSEILKADAGLYEFFTPEQIEIMGDAVFDHRASLNGEPRTIYGKIVSSADRNTRVDVAMKRTYQYRIKNNPDMPLDKIIEESRIHLKTKFGKEGYATTKMYFEDTEYEEFLKEMDAIASNPILFRELYIKANGINELFLKYSKK